MASSFEVPNHFSTWIVLSSSLHRSTDMCLKLLVSVPRGPFTCTRRDLMVHSQLSGMVTFPEEHSLHGFLAGVRPH